MATVPMSNLSLDEDPRSKRGGHRLFDHSFFPDAVILRVRGHNFVVSASYLSLHSPFFHDLFYGPASTGLNGRYELDFDPHTFGDLLDMVYPSYKKTGCCVECSSSLEDRLKLALQLKLRFAVKRLINDNLKLKRDVVVKTLQENNAWASYSVLFGYYTPVNKVAMTRDMSDALDPLLITDKFPDATTVITRGITILVSASTLAICSPFLSKLVYNDGQKLTGVKIDMDLCSFASFLQASIGDFPSDLMVKFLDDILAVDATPMYDYYLSEIKKQMSNMNRKGASKSAMLLLEHYSHRQTLDMDSMKRLLSYFERNDLDVALTKCNSLSRIVKSELVKTFEEATKNPIQIFMKNLYGKTLAFNLPKGTSTQLSELKQMVFRREGIPVDLQRLTFESFDLKGEKTLHDFGVRAESTLHLVLRLEGC